MSDKVMERVHVRVMVRKVYKVYDGAMNGEYKQSGERMEGGGQSNTSCMPKTQGPTDLLNVHVG